MALSVTENDSFCEPVQTAYRRAVDASGRLPDGISIDITGNG